MAQFESSGEATADLCDRAKTTDRRGYLPIWHELALNISRPPTMRRHKMPLLFIKRLATCQPFDATELINSVPTSIIDSTSIGDDDEFVRAPFPNLWLEWSEPGRPGVAVMLNLPAGREDGHSCTGNMNFLTDHASSTPDDVRRRQKVVTFLLRALSLESLMTKGLEPLHAGEKTIKAMSNLARRSAMDEPIIPSLIRMAISSDVLLQQIENASPCSLSYEEHVLAAKKRLHAVRAHLRRLASGRIVAVKAHRRGSETQGSVHQLRILT